MSQWVKRAANKWALLTGSFIKVLVKINNPQYFQTLPISTFGGCSFQGIAALKHVVHVGWSIIIFKLPSTILWKMACQKMSSMHVTLTVGVKHVLNIQREKRDKSFWKEIFVTPNRVIDCLWNEGNLKQISDWFGLLYLWNQIRFEVTTFRVSPLSGLLTTACYHFVWRVATFEELLLSELYRGNSWRKVPSWLWYYKSW